MTGSLAAITVWARDVKGNAARAAKEKISRKGLFGFMVCGSWKHGSGRWAEESSVADSAEDADRDAAFSSYYFIGFASAPIWALIGGWIMDTSGFHQTFVVYGFSYLAGMLLLGLIRTPKRDQTLIAR